MITAVSISWEVGGNEVFRSGQGNRFVARDSRKEPLDDNFLIFWFRFIYRHSFLLQIKGYEQLRDLIRPDYEAFSGFALERYFKAKFAESGEWTLFGAWWDRKGENEIDLLAENELTGVRRVFEIKRKKKSIDLNRVREKFAAFVRASGEWKRAKPDFVALSMEEM